jgi:hypothetical protein
MFSKCTISTLNGDELDEYINLQFYTQNYSNLTRIPGNFFKLTLNMKFISFAVNKIENVGVNLFKNLKNLKEIYFGLNNCINENAEKSWKVQRLIEEIRQKCPDNEQETTTRMMKT